LQRLRREPQFIDKVFAAKTERTKLEEEPVMCVPDLDKEQDNFIIEQPKELVSQRASKASSDKKVKKASKAPLQSDDEMILDDISAIPRDKNREEIIAEAEAAAFANEQ